MKAIYQTGKVSANGIKFHYIEKGKGPLMLCLHGFPDNAHTFEKQLDAFSDAGYHVVAPFMRGYAPSGSPADNQYHPVYLGQDAVALITALGYEKAVVLGHDFGASAAYASALIAPDKVKSVIASAVPYGTRLPEAMVIDRDQQRRSWYVFYFQTALAEMAIPFNDHQFIENLWKDWSPGWDFDASALDSVKKTLSRPGVLEAVLSYYRNPFAGFPDDPSAAAIQARIGVKTIDVPTLYIHGAEDGCIGADISEGMEPFFTGRFEKQIVENAGHFVHQEKPEIFNHKVIDFLKP